MLKVAQQNTIPFNNLTKNINYQLLIEDHSRKSKNAKKRSRYRRSDSDQKESNGELFIAIRKKNQSEQEKLEKIKQLFKKNPKPNINAQDGNDKRDTPLHMAVRRGYLEIVSFMLTQGADITTKNDEGKTPIELSKSSEKPNQQIIAALERAVPQTSQSDNRVNRQPLQPAEASRSAQQVGWNCFDVAIDLANVLGFSTSTPEEQARHARAELVRRALEHSNDLEYRNLLAPEIRHAAALTVTAMNSGNPASTDSYLLPRSMRSDELKYLYNNYVHADNDTRVKAAVAACNEQLGNPEGQRKNLDALKEYFENADNSQDNPAYQAFHQALQVVKPAEEAFSEYCLRESTYRQYIQEYYGNNQWFAFQGQQGFEHSTSMVDVTAKLLGRKISIYYSSLNKMAHQTADYGHEILVNYNGINHFTASSENIDLSEKTGLKIKIEIDKDLLLKKNSLFNKEIVNEAFSSQVERIQPQNNPEEKSPQELDKYLTVFSLTNEQAWSTVDAKKEETHFKILKITKSKTAEDALRFMQQEPFLHTFNQATHWFFTVIAVDDPLELKEKDLEPLATLLDAQKPMIIQWGSPGSAECLIFFKQPGESTFTQFTLSGLSAPVTDEQALIEKLSSRGSFQLPLLLRALHSGLGGHFNGDLLQVTVDVNQEFDTWRLIDYAARDDDSLSLRFLLLTDWDLSKKNEDHRRVLEIAAEHATPKSLSALLNLPITRTTEELFLSSQQKELLALTDAHGNTPFLIAAQREDTETLRFLIRCGEDIHYQRKIGEPVTAIKLAWDKKRYGNVLALLKADSPFPSGFDMDGLQASEHVVALRTLVERRRTFHQALTEGAWNTVKAFIEDHPRLKQAYSPENQPALTTALQAGKYEICAFLLSKGFKKDELITLNNEQKNALKTAISEYFGKGEKDHIIYLLSKSRLGLGQEKNDFYKTIKKLYEKLDTIPEISTVLKVVEQSEATEIIFDFNSNSIIDLDPTQSPTAAGACDYREGRIYIGAKQQSEGDPLGTLAHELTHLAMQIRYNNDCNPYEVSDKEKQSEFDKIVEKYRDNKNIDPIIQRVFTVYKNPEEWPSELIVRAPHLLAHYQEEKNKQQFIKPASELFKYYNEQTQKELELFIKKPKYFKSRHQVQRLNNLLGQLDKIEQANIWLNGEHLLSSKVFNSEAIQMLSTSLPQLTKLNLYQVLRKDNSLSDIKSGYIFTIAEQFRNPEQARDIFNAFQSDTLPMLIIDCSYDYELSQQDIWSTINSFRENKRIIFIADTKTEQLIKNNPNRINIDLQKDKDYRWSDLTIDSQEKLLEKIVPFQGDKYKVTLNQLMTPESPITDLLPLADLLEEKPLEIGKPLPISSGYDEAYYIDRTFYPYIEIDENILENKKEPRILLAYSEEEFQKLCEKHPTGNVHWLKREPGQPLIWRRSTGNTEALRQYIKTSHPPRYYPPKDLNHFLEQAQNQKVMLIAAAAGMGKSTVLTKLSKEIKQISPDHWVLRIDLNDHTKALEAQTQAPTHKKIEAINFLSEKLLKLDSPLEKGLFKQYLEEKKVVLMLDGFDEISPSYKNTVIDLLQALKKTSVDQLWVTTRPHLRKALEEKLKQVSYTLEPFSEENQVEFLTKFWTQELELQEVHKDKLKTYSEELIKKLAESINDKEKELTGIPLQTRMLAESFEDELQVFLNSDRTALDLPEKLDLLDLYEKFIHKKYYEIYGKEKARAETVSATELLDESYPIVVKKHQELALYTLLDENQCTKLLSEERFTSIKTLINDIKDGKEKRGIINQVIEGKPNFIHRTFAEYFLYCFLRDNLSNSEIQDFLLKNILLKNKYQLIRSFLNSFLKKQYPLKKHLEQYGKRIDKLWKSDSLKNSRETILHVAIQENNYFVIDFLLNSLKKSECIETLREIFLATDSNRKNTWLFAASLENIDILKQLWEWGKEAGLSPENIWKLTEKLNNHGLFDRVFLLEEITGIKMSRAERTNMWLATDERARNAWQLAADQGNLEVVKQLWKWSKEEVKLPPDQLKNLWLREIDVYRNNIFFLIIRRNGLDGFKQLYEFIKKEEIITSEEIKNLFLSKNKNAETVCNKIIWEHPEISNQLWEWGKKELKLTKKDLKNMLLLRDKNGRNIWLSAVEFCRTELLENLWELAKKFEKSDDVVLDLKDELLLSTTWYRETALDILRKSYFKKSEKEKVIKLLYAYLSEFTPENLYIVAQNGNLEMAEYLIEKGADVFHRNEHDTVLHRAVSGNNLELIKLILETIKEKANNDPDKIFIFINAQDNEGDTPLMWAIEKGKLAAAKALLEGGVDVKIKNRKGMSALNWAAKGEQWAIAVTLLNYGAEIKDLSDEQCNVLKQYVEHSDYVNKPQLLQSIEKHLLTSSIERLRKLRAKSESVGLEVVAGADCLPRRRSQRALGRCVDGEEWEQFPYEPLEESATIAERQAARLYSQLALADAWQQGGSPDNLLRYQRYLGEILEEGEANQSPREQQLVWEHYQQAISFFQNHPKPTLLEAQAYDFVPLAGHSVLLESGQQSLLVFNEGPRYQLYSPDFNYRQRFQSRPGVSWGELSAFVQAFFQWKSGRRDYQVLTLQKLPAETLKSLREAPFWKPEALAPDSVLLAREHSRGIEGIPAEVVRELVRVNGQVVEASALHADFFQQTAGIQLRVEHLHVVLGELTSAQRRSLVRVVRKYQWAADSTLLESLDAEAQPLFADYQQQVMTELKTAETLTPERLAAFSWQAMQQAFNRADISPELTQQALTHLKELQATAARRAWAQGMATQALFFLPDMIRAANTGQVDGLVRMGGMLAADSSVNHLYGKLLERLAPTLSEARLGLLRKLPITSPVFKALTVYSIVELTQQLQSLPPDSEQRATIKHRLGEQYVTAGLMAAELLFGWELGPVWIALIAEQLIFEAITFRKENQLDIPFWEAFIMSLGFEQAKLQNIFEERQLVELNLAAVNNLNTQAQPPYGLVLVRVPSLGPRTWNDIDESQVPPEIREQVINQPAPFFSFISNTVIREASGFQQISEHVSNVQGVDASGKSIRGRLVKSYWKRGDYTAQAAAITVHWIPNGSSRQEDNIFMKQLTIPQGVNSTFERLVSVVGSDYQAEVTQSPIRITGNGLGALYAVKQPSPMAASTKNLFLGFDPREGDTSLKIYSSGWKHLESVYPGSSTKAKTSLTVQVGPKGYPPAILFPPRLGILMVEDKSRHLHSHYFISSDTAPFYLYDDTLTTHIAITPPRNRPIGFTVRSYDIAILQLQTWAPNSSRTVPDLPAAFYPDTHPGNLKQALQPLLFQQISMLHLPNNRQYLQLMLKQQQIAGMLTLSAKRVDVLFAKGQDAYQSGIVMTTTVARFTVTVQGHLQIKQGNTHLFFIGETPNAEVISYSKRLSTDHLPLYQLELPDLRPVLNSLSRLHPQETQFSTPGLNYKWFPGVERPATLRITGLLGSVLLHDKWAQLLLEHNETTLSQLDEQNPRVLAVKHYTPQATLDNQLVLQQLTPAGVNAAKPLEYQQESDDLQHLRVIDIFFPDKTSDSLWFQSPQGYPVVHRFPTQQTLTLNGIDYQVIGKQLYAIGSPNGVIDGELLIRYRTSTRRVAIRLNQSLAESTLSLDQETLTINQLTLRHLPSQTPIVLGGQSFPLRALKESVHRQRYRRALPSAKPPAFERSQNQPESLSLKLLASGASQNKPWSSQLIKQVVTLLGGVHWEWPALFSSWGSSSNQKPTILDSGQPTPQGLQTVGEYTVGHLQGGIQLVDLLMRKMTRKRYQQLGNCALTPLTDAEARLASLQQQWASFSSHDNLAANPYRGHRVDTLSTHNGQLPQSTATKVLFGV